MARRQKNPRSAALVRRRGRAPLVPPAGVIVTYQRRFTRCRKSDCWCAFREVIESGYGHGPYWYAFWNDPDTGRKTCRYVGRWVRPSVETRHVRTERRTPLTRGDANDERRRAWKAGWYGHDDPEAPKPRRRATSTRSAPKPAEPSPAPKPRSPRSKAPRDPDEVTLDIPRNASYDQAREAWLTWIKKNHPDRHPPEDRPRQTEITKRYNVAFQRLRARRGWP